MHKCIYGELPIAGMPRFGSVRFGSYAGRFVSTGSVWYIFRFQFFRFGLLYIRSQFFRFGLLYLPVCPVLLVSPAIPVLPVPPVLTVLAAVAICNYL
jgi:hypothetical protein